MTYHRAKYLLETRTKRESTIKYEDEAEVIPEKKATLELWNEEIEAIDLAIRVLTEKMHRSERYKKRRKQDEAEYKH